MVSQEDKVTDGGLEGIMLVWITQFQVWYRFNKATQFLYEYMLDADCVTKKGRQNRYSVIRCSLAGCWF